MLIYPKWLELDLPTRQTIAAEFGVAKTKPTHVVDNRIADDGYAVDSLDVAFADENLRQFLNTDEKDVLVLWNMLIAHFTEPKSTPEVQEVVETVPAEAPAPDSVEASMAKPEKIKVISTEKKRGRPAKTK